MHLTEPVTMLTDYTLAAASLGFAAAIRRAIGPRNRVSAWLWCAAFIASAFAAAFGGTYHGFAHHLEPGTREALWNVTIFAMGACGAFIVAGVHAASFKWSDDAVKWLVYGIAITVLGGAVQQTGFPRSANFNHNDAYHLIQIVGLYFLFRFSQTVRDRTGRPPDQLQRDFSSVGQ